MHVFSALRMHAGSVPHQLDHDQCSALFCGSVYRAHKLTIELVTKEVVAARSQRLVRSLGGVSAQGPSLLISCFVQLCQQRMKVCMTPSMQLSNNVRAMFEVRYRCHQILFEHCGI